MTFTDIGLTRLHFAEGDTFKCLRTLSSDMTETECVAD